MADLILHRARRGGGRFRTIRVEVNDTTSVELRPRRTKRLSLPEGPVRIRARLDWTSSEVLETTLSEHQSLRVEVSLPWRALLRSFSEPSKALEIRVM